MSLYYFFIRSKSNDEAINYLHSLFLTIKIYYIICKSIFIMSTRRIFITNQFYRNFSFITLHVLYEESVAKLLV